MALIINTNIRNTAGGYLVDAEQVKGTFVVVDTMPKTSTEWENLLKNTRKIGSIVFFPIDNSYYQYQDVGDKQEWVLLKNDSGNVTYYQNTVPTDSIKHNVTAGDLWFVTGNSPVGSYDPQKWYRYNGESWDEITDGDLAKATSNIQELQIDVNGLTSTVGEHTTSISELNATTTNHETRITQNADNISTKVSETIYNEKMGELDGAILGLDGKISHAETEISQNAAAINARVTKDTYDAGISELDAKITTTNAELEILDGKLSEKANATVVDALGTRVSEAELDINALDGDIKTRVEKTTYNAEKQVLEQNISTVTQTANSLTTEISNARGDYSTLQQRIDGIAVLATGGNKTFSQNTVPVDTTERKLIAGDLWYVNSDSDVGDYKTKKWYRYDGTTWQEITDGEVAEAKSQVANLAVTVDGLTSTVSETTAAVSNLTGRVTTAESNILQNANDITTTVSRVETIEGDYTTSTELNSAITQSANSIKQEVSNTYTTKTETGALETTLRSEIETSAGEISIIATGAAAVASEAKTTANNAISEAENANAKASTVVDDDNKVKAEIIVSAINDDSSVKISADNLNFNGKTIAMSASNDLTITAGNGFRLDKNGITWTTASNPTKTVYAQSLITKPADGTTYDSFPANSTTNWHKTLSTNDRYSSTTTDDGTAWSNVIQIVGIDGKDGKDGTNGKDGADGKDGTSVRIKGTVPSYSALPSGGVSDGDGYIVQVDETHAGEEGVLYTYSASSWIYCGAIKGPKGDNGYTPVKGVDYFDGTNGKDGTNGTNGTSIIFKGSYASAPSNPQNGWAYYNTTDKKSYVYQGTTWYQMSVDGVNGQNGSNGKSIVWKGESSLPPSNPQENWVYRDLDDGKVYIYNGTGWGLMVLDGNDGKDGTDGSNGKSVFITYCDNAADNPPSTPTGDGTTSPWHTNATASAVWMSQKVSETATTGTWGTPIRIKGTDGQKGQDGQDGADGKDGGTIEVLYAYYLKNSITAPTKLSNGQIPPKNGWTATPTGVSISNRFEFVSSCIKTTKNGTTTYSDWSNPGCFAHYSEDGAQGPAGPTGPAGSDATVNKINTFNALFGVDSTGGLSQGLSADASGNVYINASMINSGYISADRIDAGAITAEKINAEDLHVNAANIDGTLTASNIIVKDSADNVYFSADNSTKTVSIAGFDVANNAIHNGPTSLDDINTEGVYVGTDGILVSSGDPTETEEEDPKYVKISAENGEIRANYGEISGFYFGKGQVIEEGNVASGENRFYKPNTPGKFDGVGIYNGDGWEVSDTGQSIGEKEVGHPVSIYAGANADPRNGKLKITKDGWLFVGGKAGSGSSVGESASLRIDSAGNVTAKNLNSESANITSLTLMGEDNNVTLTADNLDFGEISAQTINFGPQRWISGSRSTFTTRFFKIYAVDEMSPAHWKVYFGAYSDSARTVRATVPEDCQIAIKISYVDRMSLLGGGTIDATFNFTAETSVSFATVNLQTDYMIMPTNQYLDKTSRSFATEGEVGPETVVFSGTILPNMTSGSDLGSATYPWCSAYIYHGVIQNSNKLNTVNLNSFDGPYSCFFDNLTPITYKSTLSNDSNTHFGLFAEDVECALQHAGLKNSDFAGVVKNKLKDGKIDYGINYSEFTALLIKEVQNLKREVAELKEKLK